MTDYSNLILPDKNQPAHIIYLVDPAGYEAWLKAQPVRHRTAIMAQKLSAKVGASGILPGDKPEDWSVVCIVEDRAKLNSWCLAKLAETLPEGKYRLIDAEPGAAMLGWLLAHYKYDTYKKNDKSTGPRILLTSDVVKIAGAVQQAEATALVRDLVNTPALDLGPAALEQFADKLAKKHGATLHVTKGHDLETGYPMIHAVGMAADKKHAPRLIELIWGNPKHPRIAVIGKGVCFDSGGLDIKPASGMRLMKKDMGGAAHALALAKLIMEQRLPVRLHMLIPAVENAIAGNALRPGDVLKSRLGLTVEIANTDAEGRLVLADAITRASEENPELIIDFATLTGAARVALGPDLPAMFSNDDALADALIASGTQYDDPIWRMPLWAGYGDMLRSDIADLNNSPEGGMAGAVTAALFLEKFVPKNTTWAHFDTFSWNPVAKPGRPKGGEALGLRAAITALAIRYSP